MSIYLLLNHIDYGFFLTFCCYVCLRTQYKDSAFFLIGGKKIILAVLGRKQNVNKEG